MSLKTTVEVPINKQTARCTIEVPLDAIGATTNGVRSKATDDIVTSFTTKVTAAVIEAVNPEQAKHASNEIPATIDTTNPRDKTIIIHFRTSDGKRTPCKMKWNGCMSTATGAFERHTGSKYKSRFGSRYWYDGKQVDIDSTVISVGCSLCACSIVASAAC